MLSVIVILVIVTFFLGIAYYYKYKWKLDFWKKRNVKGPKPSIIFGNYYNVFRGRMHVSEHTKKIYEEFSEEKMVGVFALNSPVLILRDLDLIKDVLIKDFSVFSDRGIQVFDTVEPLSQHLFNLPYSTWQPLRSHLSPAFKRTKVMFDVVQDIVSQFVHFIEKASIKENSFDCFALFGKCTTEVIGEYGFGIKIHQLEEEETEFQKVCKERQFGNIKNFIRRFLREYVPKIYSYSSLIVRNDKIIRYYVNMIKDIHNKRKINKVSKKDFVNQLLALKDNPNRKVTGEITYKSLAAQAYVLFTAGADTLAVILSNAMYEIAMNQAIQQKLRNEISNIFKSPEQKIFDIDLKNLPYLNGVYQETLRKYPLRDIIRTSNATYTFNNTNTTIPKNTKIIIPHFAIQRDSKYYPNPELFDPNRFNKKEQRHPMTFIPFGDGPRYCVGKKWAEIIVKIIIIKLIMMFNIKINVKNRERKENDPRKVLLWPKEGIHLQFEKRKV